MANRSSVSIVLKPKDRKEEEVFKTAEKTIASHNNCNVVQKP